jgi:peptidoglycan biosynthesis protein MviN/MurJ (putative lipid II flippase)
MATLPLLAIAPLLIPRFTKIFKQDIIPAANLKFLIRMEFIVAALVALLLNICWSPVIDKITNGKYGAVNENIIFLLSLCMPFLYLNNFLWTIYFAKGQLKMILTAFIITLFVNIAGDIILIPIYKNEGAAIAFLLSCIAQSIFFLKKNTIAELNNTWQTLIVCICCALGGGFAAKTLLPGSWVMLPLSVIFYFILLLITQQLRLNDRGRFKLILH